MIHPKFVPHVWWQGLLIALDEKCDIKDVLRSSQPSSVAQFAFWLTQSLDKQVKENHGHILPNYATDIPKNFESGQLGKRWTMLYHKFGKPFQTTVQFSRLNDEGKDKLKLELVDKLRKTFETLQFELSQGSQGGSVLKPQVMHGHQSSAGKESDLDEETGQQLNKARIEDQGEFVTKMGFEDRKAYFYRVSSPNTPKAKADMLRACLQLVEQANGASVQELWRAILAECSVHDEDAMVKAFDHISIADVELPRLKATLAGGRQMPDTGVDGLSSHSKGSTCSQTAAGGRALNTRGKPKSVQTHANVKCDMAKLQKDAKIPGDLPKQKPGGSKLTDDEKECFKDHADKRIKNARKCTKRMIIEALNFSKVENSITKQNDRRSVRTLYNLWRDTVTT